jgi:hypothetical protein
MNERDVFAVIVVAYLQLRLYYVIMGINTTILLR